MHWTNTFRPRFYTKGSIWKTVALLCYLRNVERGSFASGLETIVARLAETDGLLELICATRAIFSLLTLITLKTGRIA